MGNTARAPRAPDPLVAGVRPAAATPTAGDLPGPTITRPGGDPPGLAAAAPAGGDLPGPVVTRAGDGLSGQGGPEEGRSARKRRAIMDAAATLFLAHGYQGTSMDDIAALAAVSKQTVYKNFADKERLFNDIVLGAAARAEDFVQAMPGMLGDADDLPTSLTILARQYIATVMQPRVLQLRRLVVGEAARFPELAMAYYQRAPEHVMAALATELSRLESRGLLRLDDPLLAASHFAYLVLGLPLDRAMFSGAEHPSAAADLDRRADAAVRVFLAAYGSPAGPATAQSPEGPAGPATAQSPEGS